MSASELRVVDDQVGCPTFTGHLAEALLTLAAGDERGILHVAGRSSCSWFEFAREILEPSGHRLHRCSPAPAKSSRGRPAGRPTRCSASERGAPTLPAWQDGLEAYLGVPA